MDLLVRIVLVIIAMTLVGGGIYFGTENQNAAMSACFALTVMVLIFVFLSQFKKFEGLGIKAEMWEREMEEAKELADSLRELSVAVSKPLVTSTMRMGRLSTKVPTHREIADMVENLDTIMSSAGVDRAMISEIMTDYRRFTAQDMVGPAREIVRDVLVEKVNELRATNEHPHRENHDDILAAEGLHRYANKAQKRVLEAFKIKYATEYHIVIVSRINECPLFNEAEKTRLLAAIEDRLDDVRVFIADGAIRRPEVWFTD